MAIVRFRPEVGNDLRAARDWYNAKRGNLGDNWRSATAGTQGLPPRSRRGQDKRLQNARPAHLLTRTTNGR